MNKDFNNLISQYLSVHYSHYTFLLHNTWDLKVEEFLLDFINKNQSRDEFLIFDSSQFFRKDIESISELINKTNLSDKESYKIIVIKNIEILDKTYVNSILKIIEEPISPTIFFLTAKNIHKVVTTIQSRSFHINMRSMNIPNNFYVERENLNLTLEEIYNMLSSKENILESLYRIYLQELEKEIKTFQKANSIRADKIKTLIESICALESVINKGLKAFNCNEKFLALDLINQLQIHS